MKLYRILFLTLILSLFSGFATIETAQATSVVSLSDAQLVDYSDYIVHATIVRTEAVLYDDNTIITRVTVQVHGYLKAPDGASRAEQFEFYTRGGSVGDVQQMVPGEYEPAVGTEGIFFLEKIRRFAGLPFVLGLTQGVFAADKIPVTRTDRKVSKSFHRNHEFVRTASDFERAADFYELLDIIKHTVTERSGASNHE